MTALPLLLLLLLFASEKAHSAECNDDTLKRCRRNLQDSMSNNNNNNGFTRWNDVNNQCRTVLDNFNCLLWQTSRCLGKDDQEANGDVILKSWRYLGSFCETQGNWWIKRCYQRDDVKRCEALLPSKGSSIDVQSCGSYVNFRDCVTSVVEAECSSEEQRLLETYLMDKGQQRAWRCPKDYDKYPSSLGPASAPLSADREYESRATVLSDSSYGYCISEARKPLQDCLDTFESKQKEAQDHNDSDMRNHVTCCAMVTYEDCVEKLLRDRCGAAGSREARNIVSLTKSRYYLSCNDHTMNECSSADMITAKAFMYMLLALFTIFINVRK